MAKRTPVAASSGFDKVVCGIPGFEEITGGGLPRGRSTLLIGGPGSGKTVFALQMLMAGIAQGESGIFVAFEEKPIHVRENARGFAWSRYFPDEKQLFFFDAQLSPNIVKAGEFDLSGTLALLAAKQREIGATRIVFDGLDVLLALLNDPIAEMREVYRIRDWLAGQQLTGVLTAKEDSPSTYLGSQYYHFMQFMADCVVRFDQRLEHDVAARRLQILKYRGSKFSEGEFPLSIGPTGIEVAAPGPAVAEYDAPQERVSSGFEHLDAMLGGGYFRASSVLVSGAPGTAKTTLAGTFTLAACQRGERSLFVSFDEGGQSILRNLTSVGVDLTPYQRSGLLTFYSGRTAACSAEEHLIRLASLIEEYTPRCMVVDPLSALTKAGGRDAARSVCERLLHLAKSKGITLIMNALVSNDLPELESTDMHISTIADTWVHLSYLVRGGERNRALSIIKARGTAHSNQVRELTLSSDGLNLTEVYSAGGEVLMGTLRWEREAEERAKQAELQAEYERRRRSLAASAADTAKQIDALRAELESKQAELEALSTLRIEGKQRVTDHDAQVRKLRAADGNGSEALIVAPALRKQAKKPGRTVQNKREGQ